MSQHNSKHLAPDRLILSMEDENSLSPEEKAIFRSARPAKKKNAPWNKTSPTWNMRPKGFFRPLKEHSGF